MGLGLLFIGFLQRIVVGVGFVFAVLLFTWLGIPRRAAITVNRRATN